MTKESTQEPDLVLVTHSWMHLLMKREKTQRHYWFVTGTQEGVTVHVATHTTLMKVFLRGIIGSSFLVLIILLNLGYKDLWGTCAWDEIYVYYPINILEFDLMFSCYLSVCSDACS